ncbi:MAG: hypothetical protein H6700_12465, partial [Myxococcales bacterium]|nr:hypothetical protein [Myxococcales bacterium]
MLRKTTVSTFLAAVVIGGMSLAADEPTAAPVAPAAQPATSTVPAKEAAPVAAGRVAGVVHFKGERPKEDAVDLNADPVCAGLHPDGLHRTHIDVDDKGGLADCFVFLTDAPDAKYATPDEPVELDQEGCTYHPQVFGIMKKQTLKIVNSDATLHNIHAVPRTNKEFNTAMPTKGGSVEKEFKKAEEAIQIKCDVHPWMMTYAFSMEHPFFASTAADGSFSFSTEGLPD